MNNVEGTGKDLIYYHIPMNGNLDELEVAAKVYYQSLPPHWMEEIFAESTPEIEVFKEMFNATDGTPLLMVEKNMNIATLVSTKETGIMTDWVTVSPTLVENDLIYIDAKEEHELEIYTITGKLIKRYANRQGSYHINIESSEKILILRFQNHQKESITKLVVNGN